MAIECATRITACYRNSPSAVRPPLEYSSSHIGNTSPPFSPDYKSTFRNVQNFLCRILKLRIVSLFARRNLEMRRLLRVGLRKILAEVSAAAFLAGQGPGDD